MKPFNLEAALAGEPVITRDGRKVTQLRTFDTTLRRNVVGVIKFDEHRLIMEWAEDGRRYAKVDQDIDLFMADNNDANLNAKEAIEKAARIVDEMAEEADSNYEPSYLVEYYREAAAKIRAIGSEAHEPSPFQRLSEGEILNCMAETITLDDLAFARAIEDALAEKNSG